MRPWWRVCLWKPCAAPGREAKAHGTLGRRSVNGKTRVLLSSGFRQAGKRRARAQRAQGSRREFLRHLGLPREQEQVQDRAGSGRQRTPQERRPQAENRDGKEAGVIFVGIWGYRVSKSKSRIDLVAEDTAQLKKAAKKLKIELGKKQTAFHITGDDHPGAVAEVLAKLAAKKINVFAMQALCAGNGRFGALVQVAPDDVKKAAKALA